MELIEWIEVGKPLNSVVCCDCLEGLKHIEDNSIDLVLTDPPYGINYINPNRKIKFERMRGDENNLVDWFEHFLMNCNRILKDNTHIYTFTPQKKLSVTLPLFEKYFKQQNIIAVKQRHSSGLYNPYAFRYSYEIVLFGMKGKRKLNQLKLHKNLYYGKDSREKHEYKAYYNDFVDYYYANIFNLNLIHPTQKDLEFIKFLIQLSSNENDIILDPFLGSGTTAVACVNLNRKFLGFEISPEYCAIAEKRIREAKKQTKLL